MEMHMGMQGIEILEKLGIEMSQFFAFVQFMGIIIPIISVALILQKEQSKAATYLILAEVSCIVMNAAYLLTLRSAAHDAAMLTYKMQYLAVASFYFFFTFFILAYQRIKIPKIIIAIWPLLETLGIFYLWSKRPEMEESDRQFEFGMDERFGIYQIRQQESLIYDIRIHVIVAVLVLLLLFTLFRFWVIHNKTERKNLAHLMVNQMIIIATMVCSEWGELSFDIMPIGASVAVCAITLGIIKGGFFSVTDQGRAWVFEHIDDVFVIVDSSYGFLDANTYAIELFPELKHMKKNLIVPGPVLALFLQDAAEVEIKGRIFERNVATLYQNKKNTKVAGYSLTLMDVTGQKELVRQAQSANEAKSAFLSNMSHEIRTPMNAIVGMTEMLLRGELRPEQKEYIENIKISGNSLLSIINDILDFSKIEAGKMEIVEEEYQPMSMFSDLGMMFLSRIGEKPVELLFDIDEKMPAKLQGDSIRIRQVIINILNNAVKFTQEGFVQMKVQAKTMGEDNIELQFEIRDSGQGMRPEDMEKLFQAFSQVDERKNHSKEGTGLGLAISKQLVEAMGGTIGVESTYGEGSCFTFAIPQKILSHSQAVTLRKETKGSRVSALFSDGWNQKRVEELAKAYGLIYVDASEVTKQKQQVDYFFTDVQIWQQEGEVLFSFVKESSHLCVLHNPMKGHSKEERLTWMNKPLYSLNFCQGIHQEKQTDAVGAYEDIYFKAPDAKILLVDDNEMNQTVALGLLEPLEMEIHTATNGKEALDMLQKQAYDLVFMDHMMPVMDGVEATKILRSWTEERYHSLPVIALTAGAMSEDKKEYQEAGMNDFVAKPIEMKKICAILKKYLPKDKLLETEISVMQKKPEELPEIPELHVEKGVTYSGSVDLFLRLLGDYYKMIDMKSRKLDACVADGLVRDFTIEVHALKNTSRMIGALELSELFYQLELLGKEEQLEKIKPLWKEAREIFLSLKDVLRPYSGLAEEKKCAVEETEIVKLLEHMYQAMDTFDTDQVDEDMKQLEGYRLPEALSSHMEALRGYVADLAMEEIMSTCRAMIEELQGDN